MNMSLSKEDKLYVEFKQLIDKRVKETGQKYSESDYREAYHNLTGFVKIVYEQAKRDHFRKLRLKKSKKSTISLEEDESIYNCLICHRQISGKEGCWDPTGQRCLDCQRALEDKIIPKYVLKNRDAWYADWELKSKFNIHPMTMRKLVREKKLKARILTDKKGDVYEYVFIKKENPDIKNYSKPVKAK